MFILLSYYHLKTLKSSELTFPPRPRFPTPLVMLTPDHSFSAMLMWQKGLRSITCPLPTKGLAACRAAGDRVTRMQSKLFLKSFEKNVQK